MNVEINEQNDERLKEYLGQVSKNDKTLEQWLFLGLVLRYGIPLLIAYMIFKRLK